jgi:hypothetical protein
VVATHLRHGFEEVLAAKVDWYLETQVWFRQARELASRGRTHAKQEQGFIM